MSGLLVSGKIQTLLDRLTATRAGYLDAAITSRASAANLTTLSSDVATVDANVDAVKAVTDALDKPPTAIVGYSTTVVSSVPSDFGGLVAVSSVSCGAVQNTYTSVISVSGSGYITGLCVHAAEALSANYQFRFVIDGVTVYTSASNYWASSAINTGAPLVGTPDAISHGIPSRLRFTTGFSVDVRCTSANAAKNFGGRVGYYTF